MNVFILDRNMEKSAQMLDDAHLRSQINEACQILMANYNHENYPDAKIGHVNHPVTRYYSFYWQEIELCSYLKKLLFEYKTRFKKMHQDEFWFNGYMFSKVHYLSGIVDFSWSKTYVNGSMTDNIEEIRHYIMTKPHSKPYTWTNREKPDWWVL